MLGKSSITDGVDYSDYSFPLKFFFKADSLCVALAAWN